MNAFEVQGWLQSLGRGCPKHCVKKDSEARRKTFSLVWQRLPWVRERPRAALSDPICRI